MPEVQPWVDVIEKPLTLGWILSTILIWKAIC